MRLICGAGAQQSSDCDPTQTLTFDEQGFTPTVAARGGSGGRP